MHKGPGFGGSVSYFGFTAFRGPDFKSLGSALGTSASPPGVRSQRCAETELNGNFLAKVFTVVFLLPGHLHSTERAPAGRSQNKSFRDGSHQQMLTLPQRPGFAVTTH